MSTLTKPAPSSNALSSPKDERPHRRLSLTRPTLPATNSDEDVRTVPLVTAGSTPDTSAIEELPTKSSEKKKKQIEKTMPDDSAASVVRVMAYLSQSEAALLDDLWMQHRRSPQKPSKSDILRAAFTLASTLTDELTVTLSQQQTNTLSRQRVSKIKMSVSES